ncbi:MAG: N-acetylmuramic acid 6-phosphate etherase [Angelakisella sp.]|jgi:N-acetylmuramic acid 6-phosphate etherase|nr:N-acetylmuramic acid 6-phosphate etherase [Angelakisella sp.]
MKENLAGLATEMVNPETQNIDRCSTLEMVELVNRQDALVAGAVAAQKAEIAQAVDLISGCLARGGRLIYLGAGTSGRLGVLDASECLPTFGVDPEMVQGHIAGGDIALRHPVEGCEDDEEAGIRLVDQLEVGPDDAVVGITASGRTPYVLAGLRRARERGGVPIGLCTNPHSRLEEVCQVTIAPLVGPEAISGSTRMKSGTAQKMVLNMLSTCAMVKLGKVYGNLMVDLRASNHKLVDRAQRLIIHATGVDRDRAKALLEEAGGHVKLAILLEKSGLEAAKAKALLDRHGGHLAQAIENAREEH